LEPKIVGSVGPIPRTWLQGSWLESSCAARICSEARDMSGKIVVAIAIVAVALILMAGLYTLWVGGETSRTWSNRLMRYRVLAQFVAIVIIMIVFYLTSGH